MTWNRKAQDLGPVIVGMPGCGKNAVAAIVAARIGMKPLVVEEALERSIHTPISEVFQAGRDTGVGDYVRSLMLHDLLLRKSAVLSTGTWALACEEVRVVLRYRQTFWLDAPVDVLSRRLAGFVGPALSPWRIEAELNRIRHEILPLLRDVACVEIDTTVLDREAVARIVSRGWDWVPARGAVSTIGAPAVHHAPGGRSSDRR
jgi:shikimate kinase